jgi:hypothetical protein
LILSFYFRQFEKLIPEVLVLSRAKKVGLGEKWGLGVKSFQAVAQIDFMLRQAQHERKS